MPTAIMPTKTPAPSSGANLLIRGNPSINTATVTAIARIAARIASKGTKYLKASLSVSSLDAANSFTGLNAKPRIFPRTFICNITFY